MVELVCWKCGSPLGDEPLPLARLAECRKCEAELHVCRMCEFFDTAVAEQCREERAEPPKDKVRANFCDYFRPSAQAYVPPENNPDDQARAELAQLFGDPLPGSETEPQPAREADESPEEKMRRELAKLLGGN